MGYSHYQCIAHAESTISIGHSSISPTLWETLQLVKLIRNEPTISAVFCSPSFDDYSNCMLFWQANCSVIVQNQSKIALSQCNFRFYPHRITGNRPQTKTAREQPRAVGLMRIENCAKAPTLPRPLHRSGHRTGGRTWADSWGLRESIRSCCTCTGEGP